MSNKFRVFLFSALIPIGAAATAEPSTSEARLDPVIVSATRTETPISILPMSVNVIGGDKPELSAAFTGAEDISDLLTGVEAAVANGTQISFQIRGIGAVDHQALTPTAAAVYMDGVYLATNVQTGLLLYDLERIEVLKGPQGTLYGRNASGGAINFVSARPDDKLDGYFRVGYGNYDRQEFSGAVGGAINAEMNFRFAGRYLKRDSVLNNISGPDAAGGEIDQFGFRATLTRKIAGGEFLFRLHYEEDNGINATPRNDSLRLSEFEISSEGDGIQATDNAFYGASVEYGGSLGPWRLVSLSAIEGYDQNYGFDFDGTPAPFGVTSLNANLSYNRDFYQLSHETRVSRETDWGRSLFGVSLAYEAFDQRYIIWCGQLDPQTLIGTCPYVGAPGRVGPEPASDGTAMTLVTDIDQKRSTFAIFTQNDLELSERLTFNAGARLTEERIEGHGEGRHIFDDGIVALNNRDGVGAAIGENVINDLRLYGNIGLSYDTGWGLGYVSLAKSYKSGGFNGEVANNITHYSDDGLFGAETVKALEVGFKSKPSSRLRYSLAGFSQFYQDPQARIFVSFDLPDGSTITSNSLSNLDEAISYGFEAEASWQIDDGFWLDGALNVNHTEIVQTSDIGGNATLFDGNPLPFAPEYAITLGGQYVTGLDEDWSAIMSVHAKFRDEYYLDAEGLENRKQAAFTTIQAALDFQHSSSGVSVSLWGRNLTNEDYAVSGYGFIGYNTFRSDPRTYGIAFEYSF